MSTPPRTPAQISRQQDRHREKGKYSKVNPCYVCGKSAGFNYFSHDMTDSVSPLGASWGDEGLVLCAKCEIKTATLLEPDDFLAYAKGKGGKY